MDSVPQDNRIRNEMKPRAQKDNEHSRIITETNLYSFNVGLLMGMRWKK